MSRQDKIDLKTPDAFHSTSDKVFMWIEEHAQTVIIAVSVGVVLSLGYIGLNFMSSRKEIKAAEAIYAPEDALKKAQAKAAEAKSPAAPIDKKKPAPAAAAPKSFADEYGTLVEQLEGRIKAYSSTRVALVTAMNLSYFLILEKQPQKALQVLDAATYSPGRSDILAGFLRMHRGLAYLENGKYKEATAEYQAVIDAKGLAAIHPEATLKLGLSQDLAGDVAAARASYEKVTRQFSGTEASNSAQQYLRLLDLKGKKG